jgi:cold shock CspA family protein
MASNNVVSGCVKWFNSKQKYGFITVTSEGEHKNVDIFVHQSNLNTKEPCYRFLVAGENVNFEVSITDNEKHPKQAINVSAMNNELLKCEMPKQPRENNFQGSNGYQGRGGYQGGGYQGGGYQGRGRGGGFRGGGFRGGVRRDYNGDNNNAEFVRSSSLNTDNITFKRAQTTPEKKSNDNN